MAISHTKQLRKDVRRGVREASNRTVWNKVARYHVARHHSEQFAIAPVGKMDDLGPSIVNLEVWDKSGSGFEHGTLVPYAEDHAAWRLRELGQPLLYLDDSLSDKLWDSWCESVFGAMGYR